MEGTSYDQKEKSMCNYICFWKRQSNFARCLAKLHATGGTTASCNNSHRYNHRIFNK